MVFEKATQLDEELLKSQEEILLLVLALAARVEELEEKVRKIEGKRLEGRLDFNLKKI